MPHSFLIFTFITRTIRKILISKSIFQVVGKVTLINLSCKVKNNAFTLFFSLRRKFSKIDTILILFYVKVRHWEIFKDIAFRVIFRMNPLNLWVSKILSYRMDNFLGWRFTLSNLELMNRWNLNQRTLFGWARLKSWYLFNLFWRIVFCRCGQIGSNPTDHPTCFSPIFFTIAVRMSLSWKLWQHRAVFLIGCFLDCRNSIMPLIILTIVIYFFLHFTFSFKIYEREAIFWTNCTKI